MQSIENLVNEKGLVLMKITEPFAPYQVGALAGFMPDVARTLIKQGAAVPVDTRGREITDIGEHTPVTIAKDPRDDIVIPSDWESMHHLQQIQLAKKLTGSDGQMDRTDAKNIIGNEVARRLKDGIQVGNTSGSAGASASGHDPAA